MKIAVIGRAGIGSRVVAQHVQWSGPMDEDAVYFDNESREMSLGRWQKSATRKDDISRLVQRSVDSAIILKTSLFITCFRNEDDGCQFVEAAVRDVHFPSVRARDNSRRRGVPAKADQLHSGTTARNINDGRIHFY